MNGTESINASDPVLSSFFFSDHNIYLYYIFSHYHCHLLNRLCVCHTAVDHLYCLFKFCDEVAQTFIVYLCEADSLSLNPNSISSHCFVN